MNPRNEDTSGRLLREEIDRLTGSTFAQRIAAFDRLLDERLRMIGREAIRQRLADTRPATKG